MDFAPIIIAISSAVTSLAMVAVFAAGWCTATRVGARRRAGETEDGGQATAARITLADLRARMRRLEAIAAGIDP